MEEHRSSRYKAVSLRRKRFYEPSWALNRYKPVYDATVPDFYVNKYTVTFSQYDEFCHSMRIPKPEDEGWGRQNRPAINITWFRAVDYCQWLSAETGKSIRLATETEWEYAAREGGKAVRFGNGQDIARSAEINFDARLEHKQDYSQVGEYRGITMPVGSFPPNRLGIHEMSGNVWEWCLNRYTTDYKSARGELPFLRKLGGGYFAIAKASVGYHRDVRALPGGAFDSYPRNVRATLRGWDNGRTWSDNRGFRVLAEP